jgi:hypothetical protein
MVMMTRWWRWFTLIHAHVHHFLAYADTEGNAGQSKNLKNLKKILALPLEVGIFTKNTECITSFTWNST